MKRVPNSAVAMSEKRDETAVVDASALVDFLANTERAPAVRSRLAGTVLHAPAHIDAEVLSALGRLHQAGELTVTAVDACVRHLAKMPLTRHLLSDLLWGAWTRRADLRLVDALYVELTARLNAPLLTTDLRLVRACPLAEDITASIPDQQT